MNEELEAEEVGTRNIKEVVKRISKVYQDKELFSEWKVEQATVKDILDELLNRSILKSGKYKVKSCEKLGGTRIVLKVVDNVSHEFALKICRPIEGAVELVMKEKDILENLNNENLVKILDYHTVHLSGRGKYPVTLEEYISPRRLDKNTYGTLQDWPKEIEDKLKNLKRPREKVQLISDKTEELTNLLLQIFSGVSYLHNQSVFHCDIKPENILLTEDKNKVKIVDFGFSKKFPQAESESSHKIGFTYDYAHPELIKEMKEAKSRNFVISEADLHKLGLNYIDLDFFSLGKTIQYCVNSVRQCTDQMEKDEYFRKEIFRVVDYNLNFLELTARRLEGKYSFMGRTFKGEEEKKEINNESYLNQEFMFAKRYYPNKYELYSAAKDIRKLMHENLSTYADEFDPLITSTIRIGYLEAPFTPRIRQLFNHPCFARLSKVTQLGLVKFVYPSAVNSRLEHSMGTFFYAVKYLNGMWMQKDDPLFKNIADKDNMIAASLAALLHDLGQYPHAHDIEDSLPNFKKHEELSKQLYNRSFSWNGSSHPSIQKVIEDLWSKNISNLVPRYLGKLEEEKDLTNSFEGILKGIISSAIDADKLDYLQRDATNLGVKFSSDIESEKLISSLRPVVRTENSIATIGISDKGILAAHSLIVARQHMFERVYWHKTVRSFKAMLSAALALDYVDSLRLGNNFIKIVQDTVEKYVISPLDFSFKWEEYDSPESMHLDISDLKMLHDLYKISTDNSAKFLIKSIATRDYYTKIFEFREKDFKESDANEKMKTVVKEMHQKYKDKDNGLQYAESIRKHFQNWIMKECNIEFKENLVENRSSQEKEDIKKVAIIFDFPPLRIGKEDEQFVYLVDNKTFQVGVIEMTELSTDKNPGWLSVRSPRIYLNRMFLIGKPINKFEVIYKLDELLSKQLKELT